MIESAVHVPLLYGSVPAEPVPRGHYCNTVLSVLQDALDGCVLLVDENGIMFDEILHALTAWPVSHRKRAEETIGKLERLNRFVTPRRPYSCSLVCSPSPCQHAVGIAAAFSASVLVAPDSCPTVGAPCSPLPGTIPLNTYSQSTLASSIRKSANVVLTNGQWSRRHFQAAVWTPIFLYAKHVLLVDPYIGRHLIGPHRVRNTIAPRYDRSLSWVFAQFVRNSNSSSPRTFHIVTGVPRGRATRHAASVLHSFAEELSQVWDPRGLVEMRITVKEESDSLRLPHDRYLFTDQISLLVSRGFDLLGEDGRVRDVHIAIAPHAVRQKMAAEAARLPTVP